MVKLLVKGLSKQYKENKKKKKELALKNMKKPREIENINVRSMTAARVKAPTAEMCIKITAKTDKTNRSGMENTSSDKAMPAI